MSLLTVTNLRKSYPRRRNMFRWPTDHVDAVVDVSLTVAAGETLAVVGESGAGKSTVGRLILRLIEPDSGLIEFDGVDIRALPRRELRLFRRHMQMIFQDPYSSLDPRIAIAEAVAEPLLVHLNMDRSTRRARAVELLKRVGLDEAYVDRLPNSLSGGQLQRVAIARALALNPKMIVCDEPVAALDVSVRAQVLNLMKELQEEFGIAYVFISHDLGIVRAISDRVAVMSAGRIVEQGGAEAIFSDPTHEYTKTLLAAMPRLKSARIPSLV